MKFGNAQITVLGLLSVSLILAGCGKKADETKPIEQVRAEAAKMDAAQLQKMVAVYKDAIMAKQKDVENLAGQMKEIPVTELLGDKSKKLKSDMDALGASIKALKERYEIYLESLKKAGGDTSSLQL